MVGSKRHENSGKDGISITIQNEWRACRLVFPQKHAVKQGAGGVSRFAEGIKIVHLFQQLINEAEAWKHCATLISSSSLRKLGARLNNHVFLCVSVTI